MAQFNLGQVAIVPRGAYAAATTYNPLDAVSYQGGMYLCLQTTTGNAPTNTTYWSVMTVGFQTVAAAASGSNVTFTFTKTDGTTVTATAAVTVTTVADGAVTTAKLDDGAVTDAKVASSANIDYEKCRIHVVNAVPTSADDDGIYLVTG